MQQAEVRRRASLARLQRKMARQQLDVEDGLITIEVYGQARTDLEAQIASLSVPTAPIDLTLEFDHYARVVNLPYLLWQMATPDERQTLFSLLFARFDYDFKAKDFTHRQLQPWAEQVFIRATHQT